MAETAELLGSGIYEIKEVWAGPDELQQANYMLRTLPKGLKFLRVVPPSESPKAMGLTGIYDLDALHCFSGVTHCPWCGKEDQNEGTVINHLWITSVFHTQIRQPLPSANLELHKMSVRYAELYKN